MQNIKKFLSIYTNYTKIFIIFLFLIIIFSYKSDDPSFSVATNTKPSNFLRIQGAYISDIFIQSIGLLTYFLPFILIINPILFLYQKKFQLKYKFFIISSIFGLGVFNYFFDIKTGILGLFMSKPLFFLPKEFFLIMNSLFFAVFFSIFIKINLYELQNNKNKKKMKKRVLHNENLILRSTFLKIKNFFLNSIKTIFKSAHKKSSLKNFENQHFISTNNTNNSNTLNSTKEKRIFSQHSDLNPNHKKKIIYNPGIQNKNRTINSQKVPENNNLKEKKLSVSKGEVEYKKDGDEIKKTSVIYNRNASGAIPRIFENERNQKLYEELQARRLKEEKKPLNNTAHNTYEKKIDEIKNTPENQTKYDSDELKNTQINHNNTHYNNINNKEDFEEEFEEIEEIEEFEEITELENNFKNDEYDEGTNENENEDYDDEDNKEFIESLDHDIENTNYYERESLLKDLKTNYQKFQEVIAEPKKESPSISQILSKEIEKIIPQASSQQNSQFNQTHSQSQIQKFEHKSIQIPNSYENRSPSIVVATPITPKIETKVIERNSELEKKVTLFRESNNSDSKIVNMPKRVYPPFKLPELELLSQSKSEKIIVDHHQASQRAEQLIKVLEDFSVYGRILNYHIGPVVTLYEFEPLPGTKSSRVIGLCDDIARSLSAVSARISVISGKNALGIELPNEKRELVLLKEILTSKEYTENDFNLPIALGKNIGGEPIVVDLTKMPHLLVAGTTGAGKSVAINVMILSILYSLKPEECKFIMIDPKMLELSVYNGIPHLLTPVVTDPKKAVVALKWVVKEMETRYRMMSYLGVRNIAGYNEKIEEACFEDDNLEKVINIGFDKKTGEPITEKITIEKRKFPYIVVIVDEMADLMLVAGKEIEFYIQRLAQMARAAGIHIIMATQRPSVDVITGVIKANLPTRISFAVTSKIDSRTILGEQGAEQLLGLGDMLYMASGNKVVRIHGPFVSDSEVEKIVQYLHSFGPPNYLEEITNQINLVGDDENSSENNANTSDSDEDDDVSYFEAIELIKRDKKISISYIQRQLRIGYNKAASIVEKMEREGIITAPNHQGKRMLVE
jgi:S-DNA-T family DNA segregation ATPase FtsK/SpoIIIE